MSNLLSPNMQIFIILITLILDFTSKYYINNYLITAIEYPYLNLIKVHNQGIILGLGAPYGMALNLLGIIYVFYMIKKNDLLNNHPYIQAFLISGALGNLIDRILYGRVIDWIDMHINGYHYPAYNLADAYIVISILILICRKNTILENINYNKINNNKRNKNEEC